MNYSRNCKSLGSTSEFNVTRALTSSFVIHFPEVIHQHVALDLRVSLVVCSVFGQGLLVGFAESNMRVSSIPARGCCRHQETSRSNVDLCGLRCVVFPPSCLFSVSALPPSPPIRCTARSVRHWLPLVFLSLCRFERQGRVPEQVCVFPREGKKSCVLCLCSVVHGTVSSLSGCWDDTMRL